MHDGAVGADVVRRPLLIVVAGARIIEDAVVDVAGGGLLGGPQGFYVGGALSFRHGAGRRGEAATFLLEKMREDRRHSDVPGEEALWWMGWDAHHTQGSLL